MSPITHTHTREMLPQEKEMDPICVFSCSLHLNYSMSNVSRSRILIPMVTNVNRLQGAKTDWGAVGGGGESSLFMGENSPSQEAQDFGFG